MAVEDHVALEPEARVLAEQEQGTWGLAIGAYKGFRVYQESPGPLNQEDSEP